MTNKKTHNVSSTSVRTSTLVAVALFISGMVVASAGFTVAGSIAKKKVENPLQKGVIVTQKAGCGFTPYVADYIVTPIPAAPNQYALPSLALNAAQTGGDINGNGTIEICVTGGTTILPNVYTESATAVIDMSQWVVTNGIGSEPVRIFSDKTSEVTRWANASSHVLEVINSQQNSIARKLTIKNIGFYNGVGALVVASSNPTKIVLENSKVMNHQGTAILIGGSADVEINSSIIGGNQSQTGSGGLLVYDNASVSLSANEFLRNLGNEGAAIVADDQSRISDKQSQFVRNVSHAMGGGFGGGAVFLGEHAEFNSVNSIFRENTAQPTATTSGEGGAMFLADESMFSCQSCVWQNNTGASGGGAIATYSTQGINLDDNIFEGNKASSGGGIEFRNANYIVTPHTIIGGAFNNNSAINGDGGAIDGPSSWTIGIPITFELNVNGTQFVNNEASNVGGAVHLVVGSFQLVSADFSGNSAMSGGAAFFSDGSLIEISLSVFQNNMASYGGGALYFVNSTAGINNSMFDGNISNAEGGAIFAMDNVNLKIATSQFTNNTAKFHGGGVNINGDNTFLVIRNSEFDTNSAGVVYGWGYGGSIRCVSPNNSALQISSSNFSNSHSILGGAIMSEGCDMTIEQGSVFVQNTADSDGGALLSTSFYYNVNSPNLSISDSQFSQNIAKVFGGAIRSNETEQTISNCVFEQNTAGTGGALVAFSSISALLDTSFLNNSATMSAGAIHVSSYDPTIPISTTMDGITMYGNTAQTHGAGEIGFGDIDLLHLDIRDNSSAFSPAGLSLGEVTGTLKNSVFAGNRVSNNHPTIASGLNINPTAEIVVEYITESANSGVVNAMSVMSANLAEVTHTIGAYNPVSVQIGTSAGMVFDFNVLYTALGIPAQNGAWTEFDQGVGNVVADPQFVGDGITTNPSLSSNIVNFDFHLQQGSSAADIDSSEQDVDGSPADAGAYGGSYGAW